MPDRSGPRPARAARRSSRLRCRGARTEWPGASVVTHPVRSATARVDCAGRLDTERSIWPVRVVSGVDVDGEELAAGEVAGDPREELAAGVHRVVALVQL